MKSKVIMAEIMRRQYSSDFKSVVVQLTRKSSRSMARVPRELGISDNVLYRWLNEQRHVEPQGTTRQAIRAGQEKLNSAQTGK